MVAVHKAAPRGSVRMQIQVQGQLSPVVQRTNKATTIRVALILDELTHNVQRYKNLRSFRVGVGLALGVRFNRYHASNQKQKLRHRLLFFTQHQAARLGDAPREPLVRHHRNRQLIENNVPAAALLRYVTHLPFGCAAWCMTTDLAPNTGAWISGCGSP